MEMLVVIWRAMEMQKRPAEARIDWMSISTALHHLRDLENVVLLTIITILTQMRSMRISSLDIHRSRGATIGAILRGD